MRSKFLKGLIASIALGISGLASASILNIDITGTAGSGTTTWSFSGAATATGSGVLGDSSSLFDSQFGDIGFFTDLNLLTTPISSGTATVTVGNESQSIVSVFMDSDPNQLDDIGFNFDNATLTFSTGDLVSFSGSVSTALDITDLDSGGLPFIGTSTTGLGSILALQVSINSVNDVPESSTLALFCLSLLILASRKLK